MRHVRTLGTPARLPVSPRGLHRSPSLRLRFSTRAFLLAALFLVGLVLLRTPPNLSLDEGLPPRCAALRSRLKPAGAAVAAWAARSELYARIAHSFHVAGATGMSATGGTQGMGVDKLFAWDEATGLPQPRLERLAVPVRAVVLPLPAHARDTANALADAVAAALVPVVGRGGVWLQDREAMHASIFHASHHLAEVPASAAEVDVEAGVVASVFNITCPLRAVLERVAVTPGGVVIACWNVASGGQPSEARAALRTRLPRAPPHQLVSEPHILHSTLARILRPPAAGSAILERIVEHITDSLCGAEVVFDEAWYVEEYDALALALRGECSRRRAWRKTLPDPCAQAHTKSGRCPCAAARARRAAGCWTRAAGPSN